MNRQKFALALLIVYAFIIAGFAVASVPQPIGSDTFWHVHVASLIAQGHPDQAIKYTIEQNLFPYGFFISIFHLAEVPLVLSGNPMLFVRIIELFLMPVTYTLVLWLVYKAGGGAKPAAITGIVLLGGWAFMDGALQVRPESLDLLLYPIVVAALLTYKKKTFLATSTLLVYSHGIAALSVIYGLAANKLRRQPWRKTILLALIIILPILIVSVFYVGGAYTKWFTFAGANQSNPQQTQFYTDPTFIPLYAGSSLIGIPYLFRRNKSELETLLTWGFAGSLIMLPIWPDRWLHYASIPLSILAGMGISRMTGKKLFFTGIAIMLVFMLYYATWMFMAVTHGFWQPGD